MQLPTDPRSGARAALVLALLLLGLGTLGAASGMAQAAGSAVCDDRLVYAVIAYVLGGGSGALMRRPPGPPPPAPGA